MTSDFIHSVPNTRVGVFLEEVKVSKNIVILDSAREKMIEYNLARTQMLKNKLGGFTKHSLNRIIERKISPQNILESLRDPLEVGPIKFDQLERPAQKIIGTTTTFIINPDSKLIVTTYSTSRSIANKLLKEINKNLEPINLKPQ